MLIDIADVSAALTAIIALKFTSLMLHSMHMLSIAQLRAAAQSC